MKPQAAAFLLSLVLLGGLACDSASPTDPSGGSNVVRVSFSKRATAFPSNLSLQFTHIEDSRCPSDANCIDSGQADVTLLAWSGSEFLGEVTLTDRPGLSPYPQSATLGSYRVQVVRVLPFPDSSFDPPSQSDYVVDLSLEIR